MSYCPQKTLFCYRTFLVSSVSMALLKLFNRRQYRLLLLMMVLGSFLVFHQLSRYAGQYYTQHYQLPKLNELQKDYEYTFYPFELSIEDNIFNCHTNILYHLLKTINSIPTNCTTIKNLYISRHLPDLPSETRNSKMLMEHYYDSSFTYKDIHNNKNSKF